MSRRRDEHPNGGGGTVVLLARKAWLDPTAVEQLQAVARLPGAQHVVGLPDLHPGRGQPVGMAVVTRQRIHPWLAGNDLGCGIALFTTGLSRGRLRLDRWEKRLQGLGSPWDGDRAAWLAEHGVEPTDADVALGTIGGGNHFAELQAVHAVMEPQAFERLGFDPRRLVLMVHSGSRGLGEAALRSAPVDGGQGIEADSPDGRAYLARHDAALLWARANRGLIGKRFLDALQTLGERRLDLCHNAILPIRWDDAPAWVHRKGAAPADGGAVVLAGSRGADSYLVEPIGSQQANAYSLAHGAGRKWGRQFARDRLGSRVRAEQLRRTDLKSRVICEDKALLYEEAPQVYKKLEDVVEDLRSFGLIRVIATLRPLITYKCRRNDLA